MLLMYLQVLEDKTLEIIELRDSNSILEAAVENLKLQVLSISSTESTTPDPNRFDFLLSWFIIAVNID